MPDIAFPRLLLQTLSSRLLWLALLMTAWGLGQGLADDQAENPEAPAAPPAVDFVRDIKPIFVKHCYECHGPGEERGGLSLSQHALALAGGDSGPALVPGSAGTSLLVARVTGSQPPAMPLDREPLSVAEIDLLKIWIDDGAVWPETADEADPRHRAAADHWAFRPLVKPPVPAAAPMESAVAPKESEAAPTESEAAPGELRVSDVIDRFVIAGLEAAGLQMQPEADRIELLRRVTFDLTGLAPPPEAILPFAADLRPEAYEELIEQLLASPAYGERWARHWLDVVRYSDSGGYDTDILYEQAWRYRQYCIRSFQEDKPFDRFLEEQVAGDELWPEQAEAMADAVAIWTLGQWPNAFDAFPDKLAYVRRNDQVVTLSEAMLGLSVGCANCHHHKYDPVSQRDYFGLEAVFAGSETFNRATGNVAWVNGEKSHFRALRHAAQPQAVHLLRRGELNQPAGRVVAAAPAFLPHGGPLFLPGEENPTQSRARLATWITAPDHPLTARVITNRIWQWHFGRGIVATPNDFGTQGAAPTHRELLDWLASDLRDRGYRLKSLHRAIMLSRTYRQSSRRESAAVAKDLENVLLCGFPRRRMEAEGVWDRLLEASGRLDRRPVEEPFVPPLTDEELQGLYDIGGNPRDNKWKATEAQNRRAIYMLNRRSFRMPLLEAFDQPPNSVGCPVRQSTTVPGQALALLNGDFPVEQATALKDRLFREEPESVENRLKRAWLLVFARPIRLDELASAREFLFSRPEKPTADIWIELCLALFNANEFVYLD
ncbi:MAG: PSD1 and planctomycete cytochrome C domain-containing protein [Planctomycetia bacterium]